MGALVFVIWATLSPAAWGQVALDDQVREVAAGLRCPVCQNLSVADSPSEMAQQMRAVIRERLASGQSREEVEAYFVSKYGQWVLLAPSRSGFNLVLWLGPLAAAILGLGLAVRIVRRWSQRTPEALRTPDPALVARVRAEVAEDASGAWEAAVPAPPRARELARLYEALRELAFDHRAAKLSDADYTAMRGDYEARAASLLEQVEAQDRRSREDASDHDAAPAVPPRRALETGARRRHPWRAALAGSFLLVFGITLGAFLTQSLRPRVGDTDSITGDFLTGTGPGGVSPTLSSGSLDVAAELRQGVAAFERQDFREAAEQFRKVAAAQPNNSQALAYLGAVLWLTGHADPALQALDRALTINPDEPLALWMRGDVLYQGKQDYAGAIQSWERLLARPLSPDDRKVLTDRLAEVRQKLAASTARPSVTTTAVVADGAKRSRLISGTVRLAQDARGNGPVRGALFVIARSGAGPPLAVKRVVDPTFPLAFTLGPEDVMLQGGELRGDVTLIARLKRDGRAGPAVPGDFEGTPDRNPITVGAADVQITMKRVR
jgi:cytochrome c-type biogenesis protein CcmH